MTFDWNAEPTRPLSPEDVWTLMTCGCNWAEVACAAGVDFGTANVMMAEAARIHRDP